MLSDDVRSYMFSIQRTGEETFFEHFAGRLQNCTHLRRSSTHLTTWQNVLLFLPTLLPARCTPQPHISSSASTSSTSACLPLLSFVHTSLPPFLFHCRLHRPPNRSGPPHFTRTTGPPQTVQWLWLHLSTPESTQIGVLSRIQDSGRSVECAECHGGVLVRATTCRRHSTGATTSQVSPSGLPALFSPHPLREHHCRGSGRPTDQRSALARCCCGTSQMD